MKKILFTLFLLIPTVAEADCVSDVANNCIKTYSGSLDPYEYCSMQAVVTCKSPAESQYRPANPTPKLRDFRACEQMAEQSGSWNKEVYHDCMGTKEGFRW